MPHWFVYYKLPWAQRAAVIGAVRMMQRGLAEATGVQARVLEKEEGPGNTETTTLMEVYEDIADVAQFGPALDAALTALPLPAEVVAGRRIERFRDV